MQTLRNLALSTLLAVTHLHAQKTPFTVLHPKDYHHYATLFAAQELEATKVQPHDEWPWLAANIPFFDSSDKAFEEMYYFRWYAWQKHVVSTKRGFVITEWLPKPAEKDGFFGALPDAAPFHLGEARWLRNQKIASDDARFWLSPDADPRKYSTPIAISVLRVTHASGDTNLATDLLPAMVANFKAWDDHFDPSVGLYWQIDTRDAMEKSIGGDGYRTPLNTYMIADATAIATIATYAGQSALHDEYAAKARTLQSTMDAKLWNPKDQFYEDLSPSSDSGIRTQKKFIDPGTKLQLSRRPRADRIHSVAVLLTLGRSRRRLEIPLRPAGIRRQVRSHHGRTPQPSLPLRIVRPVHLERPLVALRHYSDAARPRSPARRPAATLRNQPGLLSALQQLRPLPAPDSSQRPCHRLDRRRSRRRYR